MATTSISHVSHDITYHEFLESYLKPNRPVVIGKQLVGTWSAFTQWVKQGEQDINWDFLRATYGSDEVSVADCSKKDSFGNLESESSTFGKVVEKWQRGEGRSLYVKDWHLARSVESSQGSTFSPSTDLFYTTPEIFQDDWMNAYYIAHTTDDFRFVYVGAAGTFTPLHRDVYCSYSWSTNVCGRKRWWLFPPEQTSYLHLEGRNVTVHDVRDVDQAKFPHFYRTTPIVVEQQAGETIFVPSGWYHQVENLTDCISINHNWCNSVNIPSLYSSMCDKVVEVENALEDVRDLMASNARAGDDKDAWKREFTTVVQDLVKQDAGWNWFTFWRMVSHMLRDVAEGQSQSGPMLVMPDHSLFPPASVHLRPTSLFIWERVKPCYEDFIRRDRFENEGAVMFVIQEVERHLFAIDSADNNSIPGFKPHR